MAEPVTGQHEGRATIREAAHHTGALAVSTVEPFNDIVGMDTRPVVAWKSQAVSINFMERSSSTMAFAFSLAVFLPSWSWITLNIFEHLHHQFYLILWERI